jgi:hypothetical protein
VLRMAQLPIGVDQPWQRAAHHAFKHWLAYLLVLEAFAIFAVTPLIDLGMLPHPLLAITFTLILIVGMWALDRRAWPGRLLLAIGAVLLPVQLWRYLLPNAVVLVLHPVGLTCFLLVLSWALADTVFRSERIKMDQVLGGVVLYLNVGLTFATIYTLLDNLSPGAFQLPEPVPERPLHPVYFVYFSLATLTTVGSDDTLPLAAAARSLSTLEAAIGQLYPAIILARLVSLAASVTPRLFGRLSSSRRTTEPDRRRSASRKAHALSGGRGANSQPVSTEASRAPASWARTKAGAFSGLIPAKVSESARAMVTAGFAKLVELVNQ